MRDQTRQNWCLLVGEDMLPLNPFFLISAGKVAGLKATIEILMAVSYTHLTLPTILRV